MKSNKNPSRILILVWGGIGNMVMAMPMLNAVGRFRSKAAIVILAQKRIMLDLLESRDNIVKLALDDPNFSGVFGKLKLINKIREQAPEVAISTVPSPKMRSGILAILSGSGKRICASQYGGPFFNIKAEEKSEERHYVCKNLSLLKPLGIELDIVEYGIRIPLKYEKEANEFIASNEISKNKKIIGIHPGAGNRQKRWPAEKFVTIGKELADRGYQLIVFGGSEEAELVNKVASGIGPKGFRLIGNNDLSSTLALINKCQIFLSNDSGLAHCAAALGVATVVVFGPTDPDICAPDAHNVRVIRNNIDCGPCYRPANKYKCNYYPPMCLDIPADRVLMEVCELMESSKDVR
ncbi:MAG: glycosyltransferase family 9 protein [Candidatus Edwardsbacteria bacterium]|nr:glycosyltransferase family 9 protein [Candidatus Edwardsbacteria bacterium]MBU2593432.1 glycosyltransferase family 9 protein [Candidatus Edwardsbacteria bacterium]